MDSYYVTQPNAKRLAEQGYKGEFPQMVWCRHYITNKPYLTFWTTSVMNKVGLPAPTHLAALEWLEKEKGWRFRRDWHWNMENWDIEKGYPDYQIEWAAGGSTPKGVQSCRASTPDELIAAILDHLEGVHRED